jgi:hypothetical protein
MSTATTEEISLLESLDNEWIKLPLKIMQDVGPAVQTLGGLLKVTNRETYTAVSEIAERARLPVGTVRKHLLTLDNAGWISNRGREHTRRGRPRRTATLAITKKASGAIAPYAILPWWACCQIRKVGRLPWSAKAVLSVVMARLMRLKGAAERDDNHVGDEVIGSIANMGDEERFRFSLRWLMEQTGLTHDSVTTAKRLLNHRYGIVQWLGRKVAAGADTPTDQLIPNWDFRVVVTSAPQGGCFLAFDRGGEK